jgi:hypothetical protein
MENFMESVKKVLVGTIKGAGDTGEAAVEASKDLVKSGAVSIGDLVKTAFVVVKDTSVDTIDFVKSVVIGAVEATKETGGHTAEGVGKVITEAEKAAGGIVVEGGEQARKGVAKAKEIVMQPFK